MRSWIKQVSNLPKLILVLIGLILAMVIAISLVFLFLQQEQGEQLPIAQQGPPIKSCVGLVSQVNSKSFKINAQANQNYFDQDTDLMIKVDDNTQFTRIIMPSYPFGGVGFKRQASLADLKVGDQVVVVSDDNIRGLAEFPASQVELLIPDQVKTCVGEIIDLNGNQFKIKTTGQDSYFQAGLFFDVQTDANTQFFKVAFGSADQNSQQKIKFSDLKIGDKISLTSQQDLREKTSFLAQEILVLPETFF